MIDPVHVVAIALNIVVWFVLWYDLARLEGLEQINEEHKLKLAKIHLEKLKEYELEQRSKQVRK